MAKLLSPMRPARSVPPRMRRWYVYRDDTNEHIAIVESRYREIALGRIRTIGMVPPSTPLTVMGRARA